MLTTKKKDCEMLVGILKSINFANHISWQELIYKNWQEGLMGNKVRIRINTEYSYTEIAS